MQTDPSLPAGPTEVAAILNIAYQDIGWLTRTLIRLRAFICPFEEILWRIPSDRPLVDVGCGKGIVTTLVAMTGISRACYGIDISSSSVEIARRARFPSDCSVTFTVMKQKDWRPDHDRACSIVCVDVLHHLPVNEQRGLIARLCAAARPGGRVVLKDLSPIPLWKAWANRIHDLIVSRDWVNYQPEDVVTKWFKEEGFDIIESARVDRLWYAHFLIVATRR